MSKNLFNTLEYGPHTSLGERLKINPIGIYLPIYLINNLKENEIPLSSFKDFMCIITDEHIKNAKFVTFIKSNKLGHIFMAWTISDDKDCWFLC